jgi:hypothetical protein
MAQTAPMRGRRPKAVRCPVEGHPHCEIAKTGSPPSRSTERSAWRADTNTDEEQD